MPKYKPYEQKFRREWFQDETFKDWLMAVPGDENRAYCKYCTCKIKAKYQDLKIHLNTKKHKISVPFKTIAPLTDIFKATKSNESSNLEGSIAMFLSCHCAISSCDHLVDLIKNNIYDCKVVSDVKMHRTKCSNIIRNVLCSHFENKLKTDIGNNKYSLLLDESNDISIVKVLGVSVIYYSNSTNKVVSTYLGLAQLEKCNAESIVTALKNLLTSKGLDIRNLGAIGTDNASVMVGVNNGVYAKLKQDNPSLILIRCICHSLQLAMSHASAECMPRNLEFLIAETHNWFSKSSMRQLQYNELYKTINDGSSPLKIPSDCKTRWLSIQPAVEKIVSQWLELKLHFETTRLSEKCYTAEILFEMYSDEIFLAFLSFLQPILTEVQKTNKLFESKSIDKVKLLDDLVMLFKSIGKKLVLPTCKADLFTCTIEDYLDSKPYLGYLFETKINDLRTKHLLSQSEENMLRNRCRNFLLSLFKQLKQRLPENLTILKNVSLFSVTNILQPVKDITKYCEVIKYLGASDKVLTEAEYQLGKINLVDWKNKTDTEAFWSEVKDFKDASGENPFSELFECAISAITLPHSNADIERVFSTMNYVKSKLRNKMKMNLLHSLLTIKFGLIRLGKCCATYQLPETVLKQIGTAEVYKSNFVSQPSSTSLQPCIDVPSMEMDASDEDEDIYLNF